MKFIILTILFLSTTVFASDFEQRKVNLEKYLKLIDEQKFDEAAKFASVTYNEPLYKTYRGVASFIRQNEKIKIELSILTNIYAKGA